MGTISTSGDGDHAPPTPRATSPRARGASADYDELILRHYRREVAEHGLSPLSTMLDETTRELEMSVIEASLDIIASGNDHLSVLEVGCGNGYCLETIRAKMPEAELAGTDFCLEMIELARRRQIKNCRLKPGDVRALALDDESVDVVISQRCLINLLARGDQAIAIGEIHRVLRPGGYAILLEAFTDGLEVLNRAREQLGLAPNRVPEFNLWLEASWFAMHIGDVFTVANPDGHHEGVFPPSNFLSSHYFVSRVLYPAITRAPIQYNTEFVRFWRFLPPMGEFSPIRLAVLRKPS